MAHAARGGPRKQPDALCVCGKNPVLKRRQRHCDACMPEARREHGLRAIEAPREEAGSESPDPAVAAYANEEMEKLQSMKAALP